MQDSYTPFIYLNVTWLLKSLLDKKSSITLKQILNIQTQVVVSFLTKIAPRNTR